MSFWSEVKRAAKGLKEVVVDAPVGYVYDLVKFNEHRQRDQILGGYGITGATPLPDPTTGPSILGQRPTYAGGGIPETFFGNLGTAMSGAGNVVGGALPQMAEEPVSELGSIYQATARTLDRVGATAFTAASLADSATYLGRDPDTFDLAFFSGKTWRDAWRQSQDISTGTAMVLALGTDDVQEERQRQSVLNNDGAMIAAGVADIALGAKFDPLVLAGKAKVAASARYVTRSDGKLHIAHKSLSRGDIQTALDSERLALFDKQVATIIRDAKDPAIASSRIHDLLFRDIANGGAVASSLVDIGTQAGRYDIYRLAMGDVNALPAIAAKRADIAGRMEAAVNNRFYELMRDDAFDLTNTSLRRQRATAEIEMEFADELATIRREAEIWGAFDQVPGPTRLREAIPVPRWAEVRREQTWQSGPYGKTIRLLNERPGWLANIDDPHSEVQLAQQLAVARIPEEVAAPLRDAYVRAPNPTARQDALIAAQTGIVKHHADKYGFTPEQVEAAYNAMHKGRQSALQQLAEGRVYDPDGRGVWQFTDENGNTTMRPIPIWVTQQTNVVPLVDAMKLRQALRPIAQWRAKYPSTAIPEDMMVTYHKAWRAGALLRLGYTLRNVGDDGARFYAKMGAAVMAEEARAGVRNTAHKFADLYEKAHARVKGEKAPGRTPRRGVPDVVGEATGTRFEPAFGPVGAEHNPFFAMISSKGQLDPTNLVTAEEAVSWTLRHTGQWNSLKPTDPGYNIAWTRDVNLQIAQDTLGRKILAGSSVDEITDWMTSTPDGLEYMRKQHPNWRGDPRQLAEAAYGQVHSYLPTEKLRQLALQRRVKPSDLAKEIPDPSSRPLVGGEMLQQTFGASAVMNALDFTVQRIFHLIGELPQDTFVRHPFADAVYRAEVQRLDSHVFEQIARNKQLIAKGRTPEALVDDVGRLTDELDQAGPVGDQIIDMLNDGADVAQARAAWNRLKAEKGLRFDPPDDPVLVPTEMTVDLVQKIQKVARRRAEQAVRDTLYNAAATSELAGMMRFISPFFAAFEDAAKNWWKLAKDHPDRVAKIYQATLAPERLGLVFDRYGNRVGPYDDTPWSERYIVMAMPEWGEDWATGPPAGAWVLNKAAANFVFQGMPGGGPLVALAVNEIVKSNPSLEDSVRFLLPFGVQDTKDILVPGIAREALRFVDEDNRTKLALTNRIWQDMVIDYNLGRRTQQPTQQEAVDKANHIMRFRLISRAIAPLPTTPQYRSPWDPYRNAFNEARELVAKDPKALARDDGTPRTVEEWFYETYGEELFILTESVTRNNAGIPATLEGRETFRRYRSLVAEFPEYGSILAGEEAFSGDFSHAVYQEQLRTPLGPGSGRNLRDPLALDEFRQEADASLGWVKFRRAADEIDAIRSARGYPNLRVAEAAQLRELRSAIVDKLKQEHPGWRKDYENRDEGKWRNRFTAFEAFTQTPGLRERDDMRGLAEYLNARRQVITILQSREQHSIQSNPDVGELWTAVVQKIVDTNLPFGRLYYRWLANDPLTIDSLPFDSLEGDDDSSDSATADEEAA